MNRNLLTGFPVFLGLFFLSSTLFSAPQKPNVILFVVDDLGWRDLGCQGSEYYRTPNIDRLAAEGVRFTNAYAACAVCSPTRAAILTGQYPARLLLTQWLPAGRWDRNKHAMQEGRFLRSLPLETVTIAEALRESGYTTWHVGKWHLGGAPFSLPEHHGFDVNIAGSDHGAPGSYFFPFEGDWKIPTTELFVHKQTLPDGKEGDYLTDRLTDEVVDRIENRPPEEPFFLHFAYYNVHTPLEGKPELMERYERIPKKERQGPPAYAAMVESVDESVGRVLDALERSGARENTVIIFTSDNGGFAKATDNAPLRANKGSHYEGGIRVPLIISGAGVGQDAPGQIDLPVISCDLLPTILAITETPPLETDGSNLTHLFQKEAEGSREAARALFWHYPHYNKHPHSAPVSIIRKGPWKLIEFLETEKLELYHLHNDPGETADLSDEETTRVSDMLKELHDWKRSVRAEPMSPNHTPKQTAP